MKIERKNPTDVAPPIGAYSHTTVVPAGSELIVFAGQIGNDATGALPDDTLEQVKNALANVRALLAAEGLDTSHVIKVNFWLTEQVDRTAFNEAWQAFHEGSPPSTTAAYVAALARPEIRVEVEAWAARPPR